MSLTFAESQLNRETAKKTAKAFANIFYRQQDEAGFTLERHNLIRFLKTWGTNYVDKHVPINATLCSVFLKQLNLESNEIEEIFREFEKEANKADLTPRKSLAEAFNERYRRIKAKQKRKEFLQKFDQEKLGCFAVKTALVYPINEFTETEDNAIVVLEESTQTLQLDRNERKRQILLCQSILNLNKIEECCGFLKTTLARCAKEDSLLAVEKQFVYYLRQHYLEQIPADVARQLFDGFGFLYEKPILKAVCDVLKAPPDGVVIDGDLKRIARLAELSNRVASIFCDLFLLSGRNENVLLLYEKMYLE